MTDHVFDTQQHQVIAAQQNQIIAVGYYSSPCGELILGSFDGKLCLCDWINERRRIQIDSRVKRVLSATYEERPSHVLCEAMAQLDEYFAHKRNRFTIPLLCIGTNFQQRVWQELQSIAYGETVSYSGLAKRLGHPTAVRAVANANSANAISIFVPCHRVIGSNRSLTGYAGGLSAKAFLLKLEAEWK